jgi:DNA recombination-dependent growth factor C
MGLIKGTLTISRYTVSGQLADGFWDMAERQLKANIFREIEDTADELAVGWVCVHDYLDLDLHRNAFALEPYLVAGLRVDRRRVPASVLRKYHRREIDKALSLSEGRTLSRAQREELKEKARLRLLTRMPPVTQMAEVVWDTVRGEVWLLSAATATRELFEDLFKRTFSLPLIPRVPYLLAADLLGKDGAADLEAARPLSLYSPEA